MCRGLQLHTLKLDTSDYGYVRYKVVELQRGSERERTALKTPSRRRRDSRCRGGLDRRSIVQLARVLVLFGGARTQRSNCVERKVVNRIRQHQHQQLQLQWRGKTRGRHPPFQPQRSSNSLLTSYMSKATSQLSRTTLGPLDRYASRAGRTSSVAIEPRASAASCLTISDSPSFSSTLSREGTE